ncbi:hypothetical protein [Streptomyces benahoarensis]|uniref:Uncharacterized protein n=1 Tax=Streptomyces benahoarensis TaxID=2595054 RepID=A0A553ZRH7_9ACTN|nr:hypothetical protein [Streptomyces benahoarensis]TSB32512.1 hypothetical protein FNJ62_01540 [Streptomyces benahoarensis]TSB43955.1 hypothetical protein FNZ23_01630 [Streptomyces benahoarensis]
MAVDPRNSRHGPPREDEKDGPPQADPHQDDGKSDEQKEKEKLEGQIVPSYQQPPTLSMIWGDAPPITTYLAKGGGGGGGDNQSAGIHPAINVGVGSIVDTMQSMLESSRRSVANYQTLKAIVYTASTDNATFGQQATHKDDWGKQDGSATHSLQSAKGVSPNYAKHNGGNEPDEQVQDAAKAYAAAMVPKMNQVLAECANAIELAGQFIVRLDRAGTYYANADHASVFPEPRGKPIAE